MACGLNKGRIEPCKDVVGGIKAVYFIDYGDITIAYDSVDTDSVEDLGTVTAYKYELKGNSSFEQTINASRENGTTFFEQNLNLTLKKLSVADHKEIKFLAYGRPHIVVHDYNGNAFLMGAEHGADCNGGTIVTGAAITCKHSSRMNRWRCICRDVKYSNCNIWFRLLIISILLKRKEAICLFFFI